MGAYGARSEAREERGARRGRSEERGARRGRSEERGARRGHCITYVFLNRQLGQQSRTGSSASSVQRHSSMACCCLLLLGLFNGLRSTSLINGFRPPALPPAAASGSTSMHACFLLVLLAASPDANLLNELRQFRMRCLLLSCFLLVLLELPFEARHQLNSSSQVIIEAPSWLAPLPPAMLL